MYFKPLFSCFLQCLIDQQWVTKRKCICVGVNLCSSSQNSFVVPVAGVLSSDLRKIQTVSGHHTIHEDVLSAVHLLESGQYSNARTKKATSELHVFVPQKNLRTM